MCTVVDEGEIGGCDIALDRVRSALEKAMPGVAGFESRPRQGACVRCPPTADRPEFRRLVEGAIATARTGARRFPGSGMEVPHDSHERGLAAPGRPEDRRPAAIAWARAPVLARPDEGVPAFVGAGHADGGAGEGHHLEPGDDRSRAAPPGVAAGGGGAAARRAALAR